MTPLDSFGKVYVCDFNCKGGLFWQLTSTLANEMEIQQDFWTYPDIVSEGW